MPSSLIPNEPKDSLVPAWCREFGSRVRRKGDGSVAKVTSIRFEAKIGRAHV